MEGWFVAEQEKEEFELGHCTGTKSGKKKMVLRKILVFKSVGHEIDKNLVYRQESRMPSSV